MSMAPKDWKEQEKTVTTAKAEILAALKKTDGKLDLGLRTVKSIQRGTATLNFSKGTNTLDITISAVNPQKSIVSLEASLFATYTNGSPYQVNSVYIGALEAEKLTIAQYALSGSSQAYAIPVAWQVVEFF